MQVSNPAALEMGEVERDSAGLPRAWPLLKTGDNVVTRSAGMPVNVRLSRDDLAAIVDYSTVKCSGPCNTAIRFKSTTGGWGPPAQSPPPARRSVSNPLRGDGDGLLYHAHYAYLSFQIHYGGMGTQKSGNFVGAIRVFQIHYGGMGTGRSTSW